MFARSRQLMATAMFAMDGVIVGGSWLLAYWLRFHALGLPAPLGVPPLGFYLWVDAVLTPVALLMLRTFRLYRSARTARMLPEMISLAQAVVLVTALLGLGSFFARGELARSVVLMFSGLAIGLLWTSRIVIRTALRWLRRRGRNLRHVLVVGTADPAVALLETIHRHADFGLVVKGLVAADPARVGTMFAGYPVLGVISDLPALVEQTGTELVYLALARTEHEAEREALERLSDSTAAVRLVPDLGRAFTINASVEDFDGTPVVLITESPEQGWNAVLKRGFDVLFAAIGLILLSPLLLALAIWVKLDSKGPMLYVQERVGLNGQRFPMLKFRTMRVDAEAAGPGWSRPGDPRCTRAGGILRRLSLDELPQLWNVLVGHMSLVGPRPERPMFVDQFRGTIPRYMLRHHVKAGITGWAQVNGLRGDTPLDQRVQYDLYYLRNWSLAFDFKIILLTLVRVFRDASAH
ncbi:MAG TPA: undecaprenyl-phosphate glucose phosphotransferase [Candidatus Limnocylindria bacterium]|nr:undecaprenyl-phosphate glucose phosphotransferase [Candidatus Limnocylindria bacterium]